MSFESFRRYNNKKIEASRKETELRNYEKKMRADWEFHGWAAKAGRPPVIIDNTPFVEHGIDWAKRREARTFHDYKDPYTGPPIIIGDPNHVPKKKKYKATTGDYVASAASAAALGGLGYLLYKKIKKIRDKKRANRASIKNKNYFKMFFKKFLIKSKPKG